MWLAYERVLDTGWAAGDGGYLRVMSVRMSKGMVQLYSHGTPSYAIACQSQAPHERGSYGWMLPFAYLGARKPVKFREVVSALQSFCQPLRHQSYQSRLTPNVYSNNVP